MHSNVWKFLLIILFVAFSALFFSRGNTFLGAFMAFHALLILLTKKVFNLKFEIKLENNSDCD